MSETHLELSDMRAKLKTFKLWRRRHDALLARLEKQPDRFLTTNTRQLVRDYLYKLAVEIRELETAIILAEKANTTRVSFSEAPHA